MKGEAYSQADIAASFQKAVTDVLVANAIHACLLYTSRELKEILRGRVQIPTGGIVRDPARLSALADLVQFRNRQ